MNPIIYTGIEVFPFIVEPQIIMHGTNTQSEIKIDGENLLIKQNGNHSVTMTKNGYVGINNRVPVEALDVNGAILIGKATQSGNTGTIEYDDNIKKFRGKTSDGWVEFNNVVPIEVFWTRNGAGKIHNTSLNGDNIGIGTATPTSQLHIAGGAIQISGGGAPDDAKVGLTMGENNGIYTWIQSKSGLPLALNPQAGASGFVAIGFVPGGGLNPSGYKLAVNGKIVCEELKVKYPSSWPDYVFDSTYSLPKLKETEAYILKNKHLPELPSAKEVENDGFETGKMNALLLKKIEELTLYLINQEKDIERLKLDNALLKKAAEIK